MGGTLEVGGQRGMCRLDSRDVARLPRQLLQSVGRRDLDDVARIAHAPPGGLVDLPEELRDTRPPGPAVVVGDVGQRGERRR